ncbi:nucleoside diphosphate-linked moiety X motif 8 isoform X2 [Eleginops maclovinus]|uniref:nucleoside diphosphate-linked moiety X motif 8 isoform X2 n=1 Tax=Eleginops maclovinus TaxID=56733 RepID=UPI0030808E3F
MFRAPWVLTWSCPIRPLLLRQSPGSALSKHSTAGWQGVRDVKKRSFETTGGIKEGSSLNTETLSCLAQLPLCNVDCNNQNLEDASFQNLLSKASNHQIPQVSGYAKTKQAYPSLKCTVVKATVQNLMTVSTYQNCFINTTSLQHWRPAWDVNQLSLSFTYKTQCNFLQSHLFSRPHFVRPFSLSTHRPLIVKQFESRQQPYSLSSHKTRAVHQAAPQVADTWRDCLSQDNENRCRQRLGPNVKLYEIDKGKQRASQGKNQGRWASVLVSLCSDHGEPAFLFTLRSSTLKGRHKGDVSFAGGKSDPSDVNVVDTALREAREELGVSVATENVWGILKPLRDMSGMMIAPVLANLGPLERCPSNQTLERTVATHTFAPATSTDTPSQCFVMGSIECGV